MNYAFLDHLNNKLPCSITAAIYNYLAMVALNCDMYIVSCYLMNCTSVTPAEPEPADLQWSGQKFELDYNLLICYGITSGLPILWSLEINS